MTKTTVEKVQTQRGRPAPAEEEAEEEEEDQESDMGSEPESVDEDDERVVDDENVGEIWVWTRMFTLIKKRNWLKKAQDRDISLTDKQLDKLRVCDEDIEDISVRTEEQLDTLNKQVGCNSLVTVISISAII